MLGVKTKDTSSVSAESSALKPQPVGLLVQQRRDTTSGVKSHFKLPALDWCHILSLAALISIQTA